MFDQIENENAKVSVFKMFKGETFPVVNTKGKDSIFQRLNKDLSLSTQIDKNPQSPQNSSQRQYAFFRLGSKTSNPSLKSQRLRIRWKHKKGYLP